MAIPNLDFDRLRRLLQSVFALRQSESGILILVDLPDHRVPDHPDWEDRRRIAQEWFRELTDNQSRTPFQSVRMATYENVGSDNAELPQSCALVSSGRAALAAGGTGGVSVVLEELLKISSVVLAVTEFSATAPLKNLAKRLGFRGATLPGFTRAMIPALGLDYEKVHSRVLEFKQRLDRAQAARIRFSTATKQNELLLDLRFRNGHASGGLIREAGTVANLPSGEAYIVPYEGERAGQASRSAGELPVQFENEIVVYRIEANRAREVLTTGSHSDSERRRLKQEPAYGNIAELGFGVLGEWGVEAVGSTLLDEKLGLHIAFGRSDHFGGITGPSAFSDPKRVVHIDRVYVPSVQPLVQLEEVILEYPDAQSEPILRSGQYVV